MRLKLFRGLALAVAVAAAAPAITHAHMPPEPGRTESMPSAEMKMNARYPQPVKVGDLIGLPVLDAQDRTLGFVKDVVRTGEGKIKLIVPYNTWFGWARTSAFDGMRRLIAVPLEVVVILGRQIDALDMDRPEFDKATTWQPRGEVPIPRDEIIRIAIGRR